MKIKQSSWRKYTGIIRQLSDKASELMQKYLEAHDLNSEEAIQAAIDYAYALATKYGEGAGAIACQMYDEVAEASGKMIPAADPAATVTRGEMARALLGKMSDSKRPDVISKAVGRKVKLVSMDTMLNNTLRDGAQFAWIPSGDSCPFCLMLASNGWQRASRKAIRNGHARHVHDNCDCNYAIRFSDDVDVEGYDPDALLEQYNDAKGSTWQEKMNSMRREKYAMDPEKYREQARAAYAARNVGESVAIPMKNDIITTGGIVGALNDKNDPWHERRREHAEKYYRAIKNSKKEPIVEAISANTGIDYDRVSLMFDHLFVNKYDLGEGYSQFDPSYDIAESIRRLRDGKTIQKHDVTLIYHESEECKLMTEQGIGYEEAHNIVNDSYNYAKELDEWKALNMQNDA